MINPFEKDIAALEALILSGFSEEEKSTLRKAIALSKELHDGQRYKEPDELYLPHTFRVPAVLVQDFGVRDINLIVSGLLHDTIEDQPERTAKYSSIEEKDVKVKARNAIEVLFNHEVAEIVWGLSNPPIYYKARNQEEKIRLYQENITEELKNPAIYCVKLADLQDNWPTINDNVSSERRLYAARKYIDSFDKFIQKLDGNKYIASSRKADILKMLDDGKRQLSAVIKA